MSISRFEDIRAWQEARILTKQIYELTKEGQLSKDFGFRDQIQRASVSVMANIAEGFDCDSHAVLLSKSNLCCMLLWMQGTLPRIFKQHMNRQIRQKPW